ncbi:MAG: pyruvate ferredoxin oxidoreductase subunit gamma [Deltaproteobacteria bacterium]|nr:pyruvate ferredoxin oxidoreductase subunit gamma [Deltaproteobacteria bacterium]
MIEIRIHGRGGQGNVSAAELLSVAAFKDGKFAQAFPSFGAERIGAPVMAFVRIDDKKIRTREDVRTPDYLIVQDSFLMETVPVLDGLKPDGMILVNSEKKPEELQLKTTATVKTIPATEIALEIVGRPIPNAVMIGAFCSITGLVSLDAVQEAIMEKFPGRVGENNVAALERAHEMCGHVPAQCDFRLSDYSANPHCRRSGHDCRPGETGCGIYKCGK